MYVIIGATGNTGKPITQALLAAGKSVRIISRDAHKAKELVELGAELLTGSSNDPEFMTRALAGATAAYVLIPANWQAENFHQDQLSHVGAIAEGLRFNKVPYVVTLSSQGAHLTSGSGVVLGLHKMEQAFNAIPGLNTLHLRPSYFMENTLGMTALAKEAGIIGSPVKPNLSFPAIATRDIAEYAALRLLALDFQGHNIQDLLGSRDVTYPEIASTYGRAVGKPELPYVEFAPADFRQTMISQMGASASTADHMLEFIDAMNSGRVLENAVRNAENTTPTSIEDFAGVFKAVYNS